MKSFILACVILVIAPTVVFPINLSEYGQTKLSLMTSVDSDKDLLKNELMFFDVSDADAETLAVRMLNSSDPENIKWAQQKLNDENRNIADNVAAIILAANEGGAKYAIDFLRDLPRLPADKEHSADFHMSIMEIIVSNDAAILKVLPKYLEAYGKYVKEPMPVETVEELKKEIDRLDAGDLDSSGENYSNFLYLFQIYLNQVEDTDFVLELLGKYFPHAGYDSSVSFIGVMDVLACYDSKEYINLALELIDDIDESDWKAQNAALKYLYAMRKNPTVGFYIEQKVLNNPSPFYEELDALIELLQYYGKQANTGRVDTLRKISKRFRELADKADESREKYSEFFNQPPDPPRDKFGNLKQP